VTGNGGGVTPVDGDARIAISTIAGNETAENGGGFYFVGPGEGSISRSTISGNLASSSGAGVAVSGAALRIVNSTVASNRTPSYGGGVYTLGGGSVQLASTTVVRNVADSDLSGPDSGGGIYGTFSVVNSIVALNLEGTTPEDCYASAVSSGGHNVLSTLGGGCTGFDGPGDIVKANPKLGPLSDNGGPTETVALKKGSAAIGRAAASAPNRDQRGHKRDSQPDSGAYER
jgi:hypothetical protein